MRLRNLAARGWLGMLVVAAFALATAADADVASAQRGGDGGGRRGEARGGGGRGGQRGGGGVQIGGSARASGGGAPVQSQGGGGALPRTTYNSGAAASAQTRGSLNAQPRVNANSQQQINSQALKGNAQNRPRTFSRDSNAPDNNPQLQGSNARINNPLARDSNVRDSARGSIARDVDRDNQRPLNQNREPNLGARFGQDSNRLTVDDVSVNSAAAQIGLHSGDQIVSVGGRNVTSQRDFQSTLGSYAGSRNSNRGVPVVVRRNGALQTLYWTNLALGLAGYGGGYGGYGYGPFGYGYGPYGYRGLGAGYYGSFYGPYRYGVGYRNGIYNSGYGYYDNRYDTGFDDSHAIVQQNVPQPDMNAPFLGVVMDTRHATAAVVRDVYSYSPADVAGLQPGDTISRINDQPISAPSDLSGAISQMQPGSKVTLKLTGPNPRTVEVALSTRTEAQQALEAAQLQDAERAPALQDDGAVPTDQPAPPELPAPAEQ
jgi:membrane-associated protease RseP (regulator of RpoE activity)